MFIYLFFCYLKDFSIEFFLCLNISIEVHDQTFTQNDALTTGMQRHLNSFREIIVCICGCVIFYTTEKQIS